MMRAGLKPGLAYNIIVPKRIIEVSYTAGYVLPTDATENNPQTLPTDLEGIVWETQIGNKCRKAHLHKIRRNCILMTP